MRYTLYLIILLASVVLSGCRQEMPAPIELTLFYSPHCHACHEVMADFLPALLEKYKEYIVLAEYDSDQAENLARLRGLTERFDRGNSYIPAILISEHFLMGKKEIYDTLEENIIEVLKQNGVTPAR
ncbi:MAG: hypothetical protein JXD21_01735 [Candidatus Omnitrophica bacterium]|nr:hypothetical protein [Candidatus Omnitrophota bacterium]